MAQPSPNAPGLLNWLLILGLGVIWGTAFMSVTLALEGMSPWWVTAGRVGLGALTLIALGPLLGQPLHSVGGRREWAFAGGIGVIATALPFALLSWGLTQVPSGFAGVAVGAVPLILLPLVAIFSPEERIGPRRIAGVSLGFVGLALLVGPGALSDGTLGGRVACVSAAFCYGVGSILTRRAPAMPPIAFAAATLTVGALVLIPVALFLDGPPGIDSWKSGVALIYVALFPTALASIIRVRVITTAGSIFMSLTSYMVPVWAVIFGVTLMDESLPPQVFAALGLILAGIGLSQLRFLRR